MNQHAAIDLWALILAGGDGCRLREYTRSHFGESLPKQFCTFQAGESLLQRTARRVTRLVPSERTVVTVPAAHAKLAAIQLSERPVHFVVQPQNRDTSAAIFLSLAHIQPHSPEAIVIIVPSDHYISPTSAFLRTALMAVTMASADRSRIVLLGVKPSHYDVDLGLIVPKPDQEQGNPRDGSSVARFIENPSQTEFERNLGQGALWNTFIMVGAVSTFWQLGWDTVPAVMRALERPLSLLNTQRESVTVTRAFRRLPSSNFSRDVLSRVPDRLRLLPMNPLVWLDIGRPERAEAVFGTARPNSIYNLSPYSTDPGAQRSVAGLG